MKTDNKNCSECNGNKLYQTEARTGRHAATIWPGLGGFRRGVEFRVVVCADCGNSRHYLGQIERDRIVRSDRWRPV